MSAQPSRSCLLACPLDRVSLDQAVDFVEESIRQRVPGRVRQSIGVNVDQLVKMTDDPSFASLVRQADMITADGQPVVWLSRLLSHGVPARVASVDIMEAFLPRAAERGHTIFLLGTREDLLERAEARMVEQHPGLRVVGRHHGFFDEAGRADVVDRINAVRPDALFIAISSPRRSASSNAIAIGSTSASRWVSGERSTSPPAYVACAAVDAAARSGVDLASAAGAAADGAARLARVAPAALLAAGSGDATAARPDRSRSGFRRSGRRDVGEFVHGDPGRRPVDVRRVERVHADDIGPDRLEPRQHHVERVASADLLEGGHPSCRRSAGASARRSAADVSASASPGSINRPSTPSSMTSGIAPTVVATTGSPAAIASSSVFGNPSANDGSSSRSASR